MNSRLASTSRALLRSGRPSTPSLLGSPLPTVLRAAPGVAYRAFGSSRASPRALLPPRLLLPTPIPARWALVRPKTTVSAPSEATPAVASADELEPVTKPKKKVQLGEVRRLMELARPETKVLLAALSLLVVSSSVSLSIPFTIGRIIASPPPWLACADRPRIYFLELEAHQLSPFLCPPRRASSRSSLRSGPLPTWGGRF